MGTTARPRQLSSPAVLHQRSRLECGGGVAASAGRDSGARGHSRAGRYGLSQTGTRVGRRQSPVLGHVGQDRQLPSRGHRGSVDGPAGVVGRRPSVSADDVVDPGATRPRSHSYRGRVPRKMASRPHVVAAGAGLGDHGNRRRGGREIRRLYGRAPHAAHHRCAVRPGRVLASHRVYRHATHPAAALPDRPRSPGVAAPARAGCHADQHPRGGGTDRRPPLADGQLAQWHTRPVARPVLGMSRAPRARLADPPRRSRRWCAWRITAGRSSNSTPS